MTAEWTTETAFLLTELRYTLAQVRVQFGRVPDGRGDTARRIVQRLTAHERGILEKRRTGAPAAQNEVRLGGMAEFESERLQTLHILEGLSTPWPQEVIDVVKSVLGEDRALATELADLMPHDAG